MRRIAICLVLSVLLCGTNVQAHQQIETIYVPTGAISPEILSAFPQAIDQSIKIYGLGKKLIFSREWVPEQSGFRTKFEMSRTGLFGIENDIDYRLVLKWDGNYQFETAGPIQYRCSGQWWSFSAHRPKTAEELLSDGKAIVESLERDK